MSFKAKFAHRGDAVDYRPETDVAAGSIVVVGDRVGVTKLDIKAGEPGALAMVGVFDVEKGDEAIAKSAVLYYDGTGLTEDADNGLAGENLVAYVRFGVVVAAAAAEDETVRVRIN